MKPIDDLDLAILKHLLEDGRRKFTSIAEDCKEQVDVVWNRYQKMRKAGIIVGSTIYYNYSFFGYNAIANLFINIETQNISRVLEQLRNVPNINVCRQYNSPFSLVAVTILKDIRDLEQIKQSISSNSSINEVKTLLWTDIKNNTANILKSPFEKQSKEVEKNTVKASEYPERIHPVEIMKLDGIDYIIIEKLTENGRIPFSKIAKEIGVTTDTVTSRYQKLLKNKAIKATIQIDPEKLGYQGLLTFFIRLIKHSETRNIAEQILKIPRVSYVAILAGDYDLRVVALVKDFKEMYALNDTIAKIPNIKKLEMTTRHPMSWPIKRHYLSTF